MVMSYIFSFVLMWATRLCKKWGPKMLIFGVMSHWTKTEKLHKNSISQKTRLFLADLLKSGYPKCPDGLVKRGTGKSSWGENSISNEIVKYGSN